MTGNPEGPIMQSHFRAIIWISPEPRRYSRHSDQRGSHDRAQLRGGIKPPSIDFAPSISL
jgi:hypothetical protein